MQNLRLNTSSTLYQLGTRFDWSILVMWLECRFLDTEVDGSNPGISILCLSALYPHFFSRLVGEISTRWRKPREACSVL